MQLLLITSILFISQIQNSMAAPKPDYYAELEVSRTASKNEIKKSYRKLVMFYHPDRAELLAQIRNIPPEEFADFAKEIEDKFKRIAEAYEILSDTQKRFEYDHPSQRPQTATPKASPSNPSYASGTPDQYRIKIERHLNSLRYHPPHIMIKQFWELAALTGHDAVKLGILSEICIKRITPDSPLDLNEWIEFLLDTELYNTPIFFMDQETHPKAALLATLTAELPDQEAYPLLRKLRAKLKAMTMSLNEAKQVKSPATDTLAYLNNKISQIDNRSPELKTIHAKLVEKWFSCRYAFKYFMAPTD